MFLNHLYPVNEEDRPDEKIIDVYICKLRKKLRNVLPDGSSFIETIRGRGHVLRESEVQDDGEIVVSD
jgi:two-component system cell cycle response regulator CtrA